MNKILLSAESTIDIPEDLLAYYHINTVSYTLVMGEVEKEDKVGMGDELFAYTEKTGKLAHTVAVNQAQLREHFKRLTADGDEVIHFSLSSTMSSTYNNACVVAREFDGKVHVIDSRVLSSGIALQAIYAGKLIDAGYSAKEIVKMVEERIPYDQSSFALESVNYLYKGGRCSALAMLGANMLGLKPQICVRNGSMKPGKKFRGKMERWVRAYVEATLEEFNNPDHDVVFITYSSCEDQSIIDWVKGRLIEAGFKTIHITRAGGTVSCHCGPHCLGILYFNDGDHPIQAK